MCVYIYILPLYRLYTLHTAALEVIDSSRSGQKM